MSPGPQSWSPLPRERTTALAEAQQTARPANRPCRGASCSSCGSVRWQPAPTVPVTRAGEMVRALAPLKHSLMAGRCRPAGEEGSAQEKTCRSPQDEDQPQSEWDLQDLLDAGDGNRAAGKGVPLVGAGVRMVMATRLSAWRVVRTVRSPVMTPQGPATTWSSQTVGWGPSSAGLPDAVDGVGHISARYRPVAGWCITRTIGLSSVYAGLGVRRRRHRRGGRRRLRWSWGRGRGDVGDGSRATCLPNSRQPRPCSRFMSATTHPWSPGSATDAVGTNTMFADPNGFPSMSRSASRSVSLRRPLAVNRKFIGRAKHG